MAQYPLDRKLLRVRRIYQMEPLFQPGEYLGAQEKFKKAYLRYILIYHGLAHGVGYHARNILSDVRKLSILTLTNGLGS